MRKGLLIFSVFVLVLLVAVIGYSAYQFRDRHSDYQTDLSLYAPAATVHAGFSKVDLTPTGFETWEDADGDSKYDPEKGDRFTSSIKFIIFLAFLRSTSTQYLKSSNALLSNSKFILNFF